MRNEKKICQCGAQLQTRETDCQRCVEKIIGETLIKGLIAEFIEQNFNAQDLESGVYLANAGGLSDFLSNFVSFARTKIKTERGLMLLRKFIDENNLDCILR